MRISLLLILLLLFSSLGSANQVDVRLLRTVNLSQEARQITASSDGQRIYVLTAKGEILLFSANGERLGSFDAGPDVTAIAPQGSNRLILDMGAKKQMLLIGLEPIVTISTAGSPSLGPENAPVTIVVFDDFQCPYCANTEPLIKQVLKTYPQQVRLVFKNFPLSMHKYARMASIAAMAAGKQGKFWQLHDLLFANFNNLSPAKITELAAATGLDMQQFEKDRKNPLLEQKVAADIQEGLRIGVRGTPTIYINGRLLQQRTKAGFDQMIREELAKAKQKKQ